MRRRTKNKNRRRGSSGAGTPAQLLGDQLQLRVEPGRISPAARTVYGVERYTDPLQSGTPRQLLPKYAVTLNGTSEYINAGSIGANRNRTITAWVKVNSLPGTNARFFSNTSNSPTANSGLDCYVTSTGEVGLFLDGVATVSSAGVITAGTWYLLSVTVASDGTVSAAINASEVVAGAVADVTSGNDLLLGRYGLSSTSFLNGAFDDIRVYDGVLSQADLLAIAGLSTGSQSGVAVSLVPSRHYRCEDPVTSVTLRNSGSLGSAADATITTAAIATVRGTASPVYSFANSVGGTQAWCSDGVDDYLDTQLTLDGATAFTVWRRARYLSTNAYDLDGFINSLGSAIQFGRNTGDNEIYFAYTNESGGQVYQPAVTIPDGEIHTLSVSAEVGGNYSAWLNGTELVDTAVGSPFTAISNSETFWIGENSNAGSPHNSHTEYYEYLIADRVLTDDELTWLETGGQSGTAIDFENDASILLYTDFSQQTATQIVNQANRNLPILKASGSAAGELTMVPRGESDTTTDVDQADYSYRTAIYLPGDTWARADMGSALIPATGDFDISVDFNLHATDSADTFQTLLSQFKTSSTDGRVLWRINKASLYLDFLIVNASPGNAQLQSGNNAITVGKWHTARVARVGNVFTMWLDGVQVATQTVAVTVDTTSNTFIGQGEEQLTTHDEFNGLISNIDFNGTQYLTTPNETISGSTLTNASYVNVVRGKPGTLQHTGIAPRDMPLSSPCVTLNGSTEYLTLPVDLSGASSWKFSAWLKTSDAGNFVILEARDADNDGYLISYSSGTLFVSSDTTDNGVAISSLVDGSWHLLEVEFTGSFSIVTLDGTIIDTTALSAVASLARTDVVVGRRVDGDVATHFTGNVGLIEFTVDGVSSNYPLTEGAGDVAHDVSGNGNDGTITGTLANIWTNQTNVPGSGTLVEDGYSVGTWFDGANDYFSRANLLGGSAKLCVSLWMRVDSLAATRVVIGEYVPTGNQRGFLLVVETDGKVRITVSENGTTVANASTATSVITAGQLHHVSMTFDAGTVVYEIDGNTVGTVWSDTARTFVYGSTADFEVGAYDGGSFPFAGTQSQLLVHKDPTVVWDAATKAAIRAAGKTSDVAAIVSDLGGAAWYFPDAKTETLQNLPSLTVNGAPEQWVVPAGTGLPAISYGPGLLPPNCSLDLYCNEDDAPFSQGLAALLTDGDYAYDDGGPEGDSLFRKTDNSNGEELAVIKPAATGAELTILEAWDSD